MTMLQGSIHKSGSLSGGWLLRNRFAIVAVKPCTTESRYHVSRAVRVEIVKVAVKYIGLVGFLRISYWDLHT